MPHFYGALKGQARTVAARRGDKKSGITAQLAGTNGTLQSRVYFNTATRQDWYEVQLGGRLIASGELKD